MDLLSSMAVFVRVAEVQSFAAAAEALDLSPTMVANHIRALEARLGTRLIERTTRRQALTDIGVAYLERCRDTLASAEMADQVWETIQTQPQGVLRITAPVLSGTHQVVPLLAQYAQLCPEVRIELDLNDRVVDLEEEGYHAAFRSGWVRDSRVHTVPLVPITVQTAASPTYLAQHGTPQHPNDLLRQHTCLALTAWGAQPKWRFSCGNDTVTVPITIAKAFTVNNGQALLQAAVAGMGIIVQADYLLQDAIAQGRLVPVLQRWSLPTRPMSLVYSKRRAMSAKLRQLIELVGAENGLNRR